ncbi:MAG: CPBP family intramembrane glutamic endopeptidase [Thermoproteota archaeon]
MNYPSILAVVFGIVHHVWAVRIRNGVAKYLADRIAGLQVSWAYHIQNWIVRVFLPAAIVLSQGSSLEVLGFRLPELTSESVIILVLLTAALFPIDFMILWYAICFSKDGKAIEAVRNWPTKWSVKDSMVGSLLWTLPEECFMRGYLISQLAIVGTAQALLFSTFFFAVIHGSRGKFWILQSAFSGLFFGTAFIITGSLLPSLIMHTTVNEFFYICSSTLDKKDVEKSLLKRTCLSQLSLGFPMMLVLCPW